MTRLSLLLLLFLDEQWSLFRGTKAFVPVVPIIRSRSGSNHHHHRELLPLEGSSSSSTRRRITRQYAAADDNEEVTVVPTEWRGEVLSKLKTIIDPDLGSDIVSLGFVQNLELDDTGRTVVSFDVELTTPACPVKDQFKSDCEVNVLELPWVDDVQVTMTAQPSTMATDTLGMSQVGAVIAVSSCKGGVGKSTTAVNLAYALQNLGATVGIFDADVYGPSLPTMVTPDDDIVKFVGRQIAPLQRNGVRLMSFGYVNDGSAVMRGPMVTQLLDQFLSVTHWGQLDYLIIDMPPGTGDIQLTLTQRLNMTAAVIVTTPQELSFADVVRGIEMFDSVNVPSIAVVENMAYYEVENDKSSTNLLDRVQLKQEMVKKLQSEAMELNGSGSGRIDALAEELVDLVVAQQQRQTESQEKKKIPIFGAGHKQRLSEQFGIEQTFSMPLMDGIAKNGDSGTPFVLEHPDSACAKIYRDLATAAVSEVAKVKYAQASSRPEIRYDEPSHAILIENVLEDESLSSLPPATLRRECRCASCVEEMTGRQLLVKTSIPDSIRPLKVYPTGNYALSVDWSDGHRSLYPYRQIRSLLQERQQQQQQEKEVSPVN